MVGKTIQNEADANSDSFRVLAPIERLIYQSSLLKFLLVTFFLAFVRVGIWCIPNVTSFVAVAKNPFVNPFDNPNAFYVLWTWLGSYIAWLIGANTEAGYLALHFFFNLIFTAGFIALVTRRLDKKDARTALVLFFLLPVSITSYYWVSYDSFTLLLMMLALVSTRVKILPLLIGIILGMQHFEQSMFAVLALCAAFILGGKAEKEYSGTWIFLLLVGVVIGKFILHFIFLRYHVHLNSGRTFWLNSHLSEILQQFWYHMHYILWSTLGLGWVLALKSFDKGRKSLPLLIPLFGLMLLMPIVGDQTRVYALCSFLLLSVYWLLNPEFLTGLNNRVVAGLFVLSNMMPLSWVWGGAPRSSSFPYDVQLILHQAFGWFGVPTALDGWPFG